jgi:hypothetical protein
MMSDDPVVIASDLEEEALAIQLERDYRQPTDVVYECRV